LSELKTCAFQICLPRSEKDKQNDENAFFKVASVANIAVCFAANVSMFSSKEITLEF
jgi:hypothetical protein